MRKIGPNKVFRDLAWGLASKGIASLRYEKRTRVYGGKIDSKNFTHREEVVDDALSAIRLVADDRRFDSNRIGLLGHSLGGAVAPLIASESKELDRLVIMAGSNRPLLEVMEEQYHYIFNQDGEISDEEQKHLREFKQAKLDLANGRPAMALGGITRIYIEELNAYDALATARKLTVPILVVQGQRDYQVLATKDYEHWKKALTDKSEVSFKLYPELDHLFMSGEGPSYPKDYSQPRNVSEEFVDDLARWMRSNAIR